MFLRIFPVLVLLFTFTEAQNSIAEYFIRKTVQDKVNQFLDKINDNNKCLEDIVRVAESAKKLEIWALKMIDSSSKLASGLGDGNIVNIGAYDECIATNHYIDGKRIKGKYCPFGIFVSFFPPEVKRMLDENQFVKKHYLFRNGKQIPLMASLCVPDSCSATDLELFYNATNFEALVPNVTLKFEERVCQTTDSINAPFGLKQWIGISFFAGNGLLIILSTGYHAYLWFFNKKPFHKILLAYSAYQNMRQLLKVQFHADQISCINGLRFMSIMWIILGHRYLFGGVYPNINYLYIVQEWAFKSSSSIITGATVSVDTFFFISGLLVIYIVLLAKSQGIKFNLFHYYIHRYIRLTPALAAIIILYTTFYKDLISGPLWPVGANIVTKVCNKNWWQTLLYFQNFLEGRDICVGQTWYLGVDTQLYVLAPLIFYPLRKWPTPTLYVMVILTLVSCYTGFYIAWTKHANAAIFSGFNFFNSLYSSTVVRMHSWLIGAISGYILFKTRNSKIKINPYIILLIWSTVLALMAFDVFSMTLFFRSKYNRITSSLYYAFSRAIWSGGLGWIVFACVHGYGGLINTFLSCRLFTILGRLTYSMFLVHIAVFGIILGSDKTNHYYSDLNNIHAFWGDLIFIIAASVVWTLMFESPVIAIGKLLLSEEMKTKLQGSDKNGTISTRI